MRSNFLRPILGGLLLAMFGVTFSGCNSARAVNVQGPTAMDRHCVVIDSYIDTAQGDLAGAAFEKAQKDVQEAKKEYYRLDELEKIDARAGEGILTRELIEQYMGLGKMAFVKGDYEATIHAMKVVLELAPENQEAQLHLQMAEKGLKQLPPKQPKQSKQPKKKKGPRPIEVRVKMLSLEKARVLAGSLRETPGILTVKQTAGEQGRVVFKIRTELSVGELSEALARVPQIPLEIIRTDPKARFIFAKYTVSAYGE